jgi:signal transduction histidine kinase
LLGYAPDELVGKSWKTIVPADQHHIVLDANERRARGDSDKYDLELVRKDGTRVPVLMSGSPRFEGEGFLGTVAVFSDITERVKAEREIRRRNRGLTLLNHIIAASASDMEQETMLETACRELARTFEVPQAGAVLINEDKTSGTLIAEYLGKGQAPAVGVEIPVQGNPSFQYLLSNKAPLVVKDAQTDPRLEPIHDLMRQRGTVSLLILPLIIDGEVIGSLGLDAFEPRHFSAEEVTLAWSAADQVAGALARARLNEQRQRLEAQYRQAQKMEAVGRLTAGIAHDFNNLLTAINGFAELTRHQLMPDDPLREMVEKVLHSGQRAADLVRQLLAFSRKQIIEPQVLDPNTVVSEMDKMLRRVIGEDIELRTTLEPDVWPIKVDHAQIGQVIANLAVNARDAMPEGGQLTIETANVVLAEENMPGQLELEPGDYVVLVVSDTGTGMNDEVLSHLFEPFFTTKEPGKGTGLGLATVYGVVRQSGGDIRVRSEENEGTTFEIYLPRVEAVVRAPSGPRGIADVPSGVETILLVEDDESVRDLSWRVLEGQGYTVMQAGDGREALQVAANYPDPIHLLATDLVMPGISGKELGEQLIQGHPELKILYMSGYTDELFAEHGILEPGVTLLQKPFRPVELAHKVRQVLDSAD